MPNFRLLRDSDPDVSKYLPLFLINDPTFKSWLDTQSAEHKRIWLDIIDAWKQCYVNEATWGLSDWETFLGIPTDEKLSYTVRRAAIIAKMNGTQTVTKAFLERTINSFTSDKSSRVVDHPDQYSVDIYLPNGGVLSFEEMDKAIRTFMPAHIGWRYIYQTYVNGSQYIGAVLRPARTIMEMGRLKGDKLTGQSVLRLDKTIDYVNGDGQIQTTPDGVKTNAVLDSTATTISPCSAAPIGATDGIFYVSGDGSVKQKVGSPATFTRASTAVLGERTYQVNEPRFMDNGLLFEPTTVNLAASVIDVTNGSLKGWTSQTTGLFELSKDVTQDHGQSIHLKKGGTDDNKQRIFFLNPNSRTNLSVTFSCWVYLVAGKTKLQIGENSAPWNFDSFSQEVSETGKWVRVSVSRKLVNAASFDCFIYCDADSEVYIDDIQLEARPYATSFTPTSRDAAERLTVAEWVVNKPKWTCEFDLSVNDKQVNYERPVDFWVRGERSFRAETSKNYCVIKGYKLAEISKSTNVMTTPHRLAITWNQGAVGYYFDGGLVGTATETSGEKVLSSIWMGDCETDPFNGCIRNFRFSSTVHTAEKIAADSQLNELPVEKDTVLYMPLKKDLSMYGNYND